ncbi:MAG: hypothetical protein M9926_05855 [Lentimicrobium sp.]|nr:hypothetical protein [Lentimicrobium sp.]MCO5256269.1 hypothetical protein [Lentimicrobium sp.]
MIKPFSIFANGNRVFLPFLIFSALLGVTSCEYPLTDDEITQIDPPAASHPLQIELEESGDTLFIFNRLRLNYRLSAFGLDVHAGEMLLSDDRWELYNDS